MFSDWFLSLFGSLTLKKTRQITQVTQAFVPKHGCALAEKRVLFLTSCHRGRSLGVCSMCFCHSSVWQPAFLLKEMVSSWYVPTARGRPPPHPASFSSPDCRFISRVSPGHDYTLRLFSSPPFLFFFETSWKRSTENTLIRNKMRSPSEVSVFEKCQRTICSAALWRFFAGAFCRHRSFIIQGFSGQQRGVIVGVVCACVCVWREDQRPSIDELIHYGSAAARAMRPIHKEADE